MSEAPEQRGNARPIGPSEKAVAVAIADGRRHGEELPRIVAKGRGLLAEEILELAFASGVKVREDAELVEILEAIELDSPVPLEALATVAEILSYVYAAGRKEVQP